MNRRPKRRDSSVGHPLTANEEHAMTKKQSNPPDFRSAKSGRFVTEDYAKRNPDTTVKERNPPPKKSGK